MCCGRRREEEMSEDAAVEEFDRQLDRLVSVLPAALGVDPHQFTQTLAPLRAVAAEVAPRGSEAAGSAFVLIPDVAGVDLDSLVPLLSLEGSGRPGIVDRNHGPEGLRPYRPLPELNVPAVPYLLVDVERGEEFCDIRPGDAVTEIVGRGRSPLTIAEGIVLHLVRPDLLQKNRCYMLAGSRRGDRRVPALWISQGAPKLGWCWEGNPHSWLGTASAAARRGAS